MASVEDLQTQKSIAYLTEVETLAQEILTLKESKLSMSNAQNKFREALRALESTDDRKTWMQMGSVYVERPTEECKQILKDEIGKSKDDLQELEEKIKNFVHTLRDLEHEPRLEGFTLKPISSSEARTLHKAFGVV